MDKIDVTPKTLDEFVTMVEMHNLYHSHEVTTKPGNNGRLQMCRVCHMPIEDGKKGKETFSRKGNTAAWGFALSLEGFGSQPGEYNPIWLLAWYIKAREFNIVDALLRVQGGCFKSGCYVDEVKATILRWFNPVIAMKEGFKPQAYARAAFIFAQRIAASDEMRNGASHDPEWAFEYAAKIDKAAHNITRNGSCRYMETAMSYASIIDKGYHPSTLSKALETERTSIQYLENHYAAGKHPDMNSIIKGRWVRTASTAIKYAKIVGPEDDTRAIVHREKDAAKCMAYALEVDAAPRDDTRQVIIETGDAVHIYRYAQQVDKAGRDDTRAASLLDARSAYDYARNVDKAPRDDTRTAACQEPNIALRYAQDVDKAPCDETRNAACKSIGNYGLEYALMVDQAPHHDTRMCACHDPDTALRYAKEVDHGENIMTHRAVCAKAAIAYSYACYLNQPDDETRRAACMEPRWAHNYAEEVDRVPRNDTREAAQFDSEYAQAYHGFEMRYYALGLGSLDLFAALDMEENKKQHCVKIYTADANKWEVMK